MREDRIINVFFSSLGDTKCLDFERIPFALFNFCDSSSQCFLPLKVSSKCMPKYLIGSDG